MYVYIISKAIERGYVPAKTYATTGRKGFQGVLTQISLGKDGRTNIKNMSGAVHGMGVQGMGVAPDGWPNLPLSRSVVKSATHCHPGPRR